MGALEQSLANVVESANQLTQAVNGKMGQIDQKVVDAQAQFDEWRNKKDLVGSVGGFGTMRMNIFQGFVHSTQSSDAGFGDFEGPGKVINLDTNANVYIHFKTPLNVNVHTEMFWFNIRGYSYGSSLIIDEVFAGYCYAADLSLASAAAFGNLNPQSYVDANGNVVLRILLPNIYYTTIRIDTMNVGNGRLFALGDLNNIKTSLAATVVFP